MPTLASSGPMRVVQRYGVYIGMIRAIRLLGFGTRASEDLGIMRFRAYWSEDRGPGHV